MADVGKYLRLHDGISTKGLPLVSASGVKNGFHEQVKKSNADPRVEIFVKRKHSPWYSQISNDEKAFSPADKPALRRDAAWSSTPTLHVSQRKPVSQAQNQLANQYDAFDQHDGVALSKISGGQPEFSRSEISTYKSKKFKLWAAIHLAIHNFFTRTTFHGLPHIAASRSFVRICYWVTLMFIAVGLMLWVLAEISMKYFNFDTFIKTELQVHSKLRFPAVTICNLNLYAKSAIQNSLNYTDDELYEGTLFLDALSARRVLTRDFDFGPLAEKYTNDFAEFDFKQFSHKLENMLVSCYFNNHKCYTSNFTYNVNINGGCFTFNNNATGVLYSTSPGILNGLELILNVEEYEYFVADVGSVGFKIYVHRQDDFPYLGEHQGFTVSPGIHTDVVLSTNYLEYLEPPYGACSKDMKLDYYSIYTREACLDECRTKVMIKMCGCRLFYMPGNANVCDTNVYARCALNLLTHFWKNYECHCPLPCRIPESYQYDLSYSRYPSKHFPLLLQKAGALRNQSGLPTFIRELNDTDNATLLEFYKENVLKITLYYNQLSLNKVTEVLEYEVFQFVADFGGNLGLFTGAGFLTFFELIDICLSAFSPVTDEN